ncbi:ATP-binding protein [Streptomyces sp. MCA2]|uniref:ATP-binding protein n=1 Tax=Streptomyces sp. MCA2 TaxID=2944805 RepID=UPI002021368F|nr:ATP-binding protein [Streptomyces sp. MCA2]MCL7493238.1 ATP-binding protein [Streptomyces sp. MCA2]
MSDTVPQPRATGTQGISTRGTPQSTLTSRSAQHAVLALPAQNACVRSARRFAAALLAWWHLPDDEQDTAVLIVSELTTNAAQHGHSDMTLRLTLGPDMLHITVADHGGLGPPMPSPSGDDPDEHGRGLHIVRTLAARLHIHQDSSGRQVHASLRIIHPQPPAAGDGTNPRTTHGGRDQAGSPPPRPRRHTYQAGTVDTADADRPDGRRRQLWPGPMGPQSKRPPVCRRSIW